MGITNLTSSTLSLGWLIQLHLIVSDFDIHTPSTITRIILAALTFLGSVICIFYQGKSNISETSTILKKLSQRLWHKFVSLDYLEFKEYQRIYFFDVFIVNLWRVRTGVQSLLLNTIPALFSGIFLTIFLIIVHPIIAVIFFSGYGLMSLLQLYFTRSFSKITRSFHGTWRSHSYQMGRLFDQYELHKIGRGQDSMEQEFSSSANHFFKKGDEVSTQKLKWSGIQTIILQVSRIGTLVVLYVFYEQGMIPMESMLTVIIIMGWLQTQLAKVQGAIPGIMEAADSYRLIRDFLSKNEATQAPLQPPADNTGERIQNIRLNDTSFQYLPGKTVLRKVNLHLEKGKVYLLKGNNASGKTTLAKILVGLLELKTGKITINGKSIRGKLSTGVQNRISYLHQDFSLFYGSLRENYSFGSVSDHLNFENLYIDLMPDIPDHNQHIGERGERLSGGQRQRLALIREWGKDSDLYILDEPLNHLDEDATAWLKQSIESKREDSIILIISHLEGFEHLADETLKLENGKLNQSIPQFA